MDFEVDRTNLHECRIVDVEPPTLQPGQALLRVDVFALTSNNITYAAFGDALNYWGFFPARDAAEWGRVPVWGYASVLATTHDDVVEGTRVYGYLPMSTHLAVSPGRLDEGGFTDMRGIGRRWPACTTATCAPTPIRSTTRSTKTTACCSGHSSTRRSSSTTSSTTTALSVPPQS